MTGVENGLIEIVTTVSTEQEALDLARALVHEKLAACVTMDEVRSIYRWRGKICDEREMRVIVKTTERSADRTQERIGVLHPYETPAIVRLPALAANDDYRQWVQGSVRDREGS